MTVRLLVGVAAAAALVIGCTSAPEPRPSYLAPQSECAAAADPARLCIVILGDSIGSGVPLQGDDRWWVKLQAGLAQDLPMRHVVVDDWAVSGSRVDLLETIAPGQPELDTYDVAIVIEGVNDQAGTPIEVWMPRYEAAVAAIEARGPLVIVATPPPGFEDGAFTSRYEPTAEAIRQVASRGRPLMDIAARWREDGAALAATYYVDVIHQSAAGQTQMAELARGVVIEAVGAP